MARNSSRKLPYDAAAGSVKSATQYGLTVNWPRVNSAQWPGGRRKTPLKIVRGDGMQWK